jgi:hypothetical protein
VDADAMKMDKRRIKLWGMLVFSTMFTTYQLVFNRPASRTVPGAGQTATPAAATAAPVPDPAAAPAAEAAVPAAPVVPLAPADLAVWRAGMPEAARDPFFTAAEIEAMGQPTLEAPVAVAPPAPLPTYTLKLVLMEGTEGRALIDNQVVQVGDRVGDERVAQIFPDAVVLERGGSRRRLELAGSRPAQITLERTR